MPKTDMKTSIGSTIYDVARLAEVSISTVSRYLNTPEKVNKQTGGKILEVMNRLAYIPHGNSGSKASRQIGRIGVLTPYFPSPSFVQRLQGMTPIFRTANFEMVVYIVDTPLQLEEYLHSIPFTKRLDGLIVMSMRIGERDTARLLKANLKVVMIESDHPEFTSIEADSVRGGALAARTFIDKSYFPCGFIGEATVHPYSLQPSDLRLKGYREELARSGHAIRSEHVRLGEGNVEDAKRMALELLTLPKRPRAIFAMSDLQAIGVIKAVRELNLRSPEDVAILGFDDIEAAGYLDLSTISQSLAESGRLAAEVVIGNIQNPDRPRQRIQLQVSVVERGTT